MIVALGHDAIRFWSRRGHCKQWQGVFCHLKNANLIAGVGVVPVGKFGTPFGDTSSGYSIWRERRPGEEIGSRCEATGRCPSTDYHSQSAVRISQFKKSISAFGFRKREKLGKKYARQSKPKDQDLARNIVPSEEISEFAMRNIGDAYGPGGYPGHPPRSASEKRLYEDTRRLFEDDEDDSDVAALRSMFVDKGVLQTIDCLSRCNCDITEDYPMLTE